MISWMDGVKGNGLGSANLGHVISSAGISHQALLDEIYLR